MDDRCDLRHKERDNTWTRPSNSPPNETNTRPHVTFRSSQLLASELQANHSLHEQTPTCTCGQHVHLTSSTNRHKTPRSGDIALNLTRTPATNFHHERRNHSTTNHIELPPASFQEPPGQSIHPTTGVFNQQHRLLACRRNETKNPK